MVKSYTLANLTSDDNFAAMGINELLKNANPRPILPRAATVKTIKNPRQVFFRNSLPTDLIH